MDAYLGFVNVLFGEVCAVGCRLNGSGGGGALIDVEPAIDVSGGFSGSSGASFVYGLEAGWVHDDRRSFRFRAGVDGAAILPELRSEDSAWHDGHLAQQS